LSRARSKRQKDWERYIYHQRTQSDFEAHYHELKTAHKQLTRENSFFDPLSPTKELICMAHELTTAFTTFERGEVLRDRYDQGTYQTTVLTRQGQVPYADLLPMTNLM
jgi:hypothetical protein